MAGFAALNFILGAGLCLLGLGLLSVGGWKDKLMGLVIIAVGMALVTGGAIMIAGLDR